MKKQDLEFYLERGDSFGFYKDTNKDYLIGWVLLWKRKPDERYLSLLKPGEDPDFVIKQELIRQKPYRVLILELHKDIYASDKYETDDDYELKQHFDFTNLEEIELFLKQFSLSLENIKWRSEIHAP